MSLKEHLEDNGAIVIRSPLPEKLGKHYFSFFPKALEIDLKRYLSNEKINALFSTNGFIQYLSYEIDESYLEESETLLKLIETKGFSILWSIPDESLKKEVSQIKENCDQNTFISVARLIQANVFFR